ncbi:NAD(P)/FAD-dependent oxidoreductase [Sphingomonas astaxanthinifaciens]|uniref:Glycerol-3-phosphate dehydrogenase n=1 Tax=Sphingomonas astaxanthinifaciens DSM 22298 TaxID=1123267 RepID=A0ABQ5Z723_9SPHN|nr:FAD-binding oxidoreductase [Sphingomonas astaxanthinifaciens]GLR47811.1 glycerol-3-phosphate dehydrogenase [Sphingomonas astaxanthinifaciens DSM 22298]
MHDTEVLIVGAGIAGASLAAALASRRSVTLVEAEAQPGYHSTGRSAAFWHEGYGGPLVAPLTRASRPLLEAGGYLDPRGAIHLARPGEEIALVEGVAVRPLSRAELEERLPGLAPSWTHGALEEGLADIDVARLHADALATARRAGARVRTSAAFAAATRLAAGGWSVRLADGTAITAGLIVDAAGAWGDDVAANCGIAPLGLAPKRRTMVQLRLGRTGLRRLPLVVGADGSFYFKGEGDRTIWLSPHDEIDSAPCDAAPEELDVAIAIDRFQHVVDWPIEKVERRWAGLRTFTPDRVPAIGVDPAEPGFFWCVGQGGFGIQTAPAAAQLGAALILGDSDLPAGVEPGTYDPARFR